MAQPTPTSFTRHAAEGYRQFPPARIRAGQAGQVEIEFTMRAGRSYMLQSADTPTGLRRPARRRVHPGQGLEKEVKRIPVGPAETWPSASIGCEFSVWQINDLGLPCWPRAPGSAAWCDQMDIQVAVLCDAATDYKGKLNLLGTFNSVYTKELRQTIRSAQSCCGSFKLVEEVSTSCESTSSTRTASSSCPASSCRSR